MNLKMTTKPRMASTLEIAGFYSALIRHDFKNLELINDDPQNLCDTKSDPHRLRGYQNLYLFMIQIDFSYLPQFNVVITSLYGPIFQFCNERARLKERMKFLFMLGQSRNTLCIAVCLQKFVSFCSTTILCHYLQTKLQRKDSLFAQQVCMEFPT